MRKHRIPWSKRPVVRILVIWAIAALALGIMAWLLSGLRVDSVEAAFLAAAAIGLINAVLWPLLSSILLPFAVLTLGLLALVLNGGIIWAAGQFVPGFHVDNLWTAMLTALGMTAINIILSTLLTIDDDNSYYRNVVRRRMKRREKPEETDVPGVLFLEIDGLSEPVLERAIEKGYAPTLARMLESGSHRLVPWETDLSSQTSASQAGLLHGNNGEIPAFRWFDRERQEIISSSSPQEVARLENERSNGDGLLALDGASRGNLFTGDASRVMNTASAITDLSRFKTSEFYAYFANPYSFARTLLLTVWDIVLEKYQFWQARRKDVQPRLDRHHRGGIYPILRAFTTVLMRELNTYTLIGDMYAGVASAYATFVGYDEVAHHSGVESEDAFDALYKLDQQFARLESAAQSAPRPYRFVFLSDHGQSGGATFKQRYGMSLEEFVAQELTDRLVIGAAEVHEDWSQVNVFLTQAVNDDNKAVSVPVGRALRSRTSDDQVALGPEAHQPAMEQGSKVEEAGASSQAEEIGEEVQESLVVLASGNLGLVYGTERKQRITLEEIEEEFPGFIDTLVGHEGIGFVLVRSQQDGAVVIGKGGRYYLDGDRVEGENPLSVFGPRAADHLRRSDGFRDAPDLLVNSFYDVETNQVAAFEELIGNHGGLGGYQTRPFVLYPAEWEQDMGELVGAEAVFRQFKRWLGRVQPQPGTQAGAGQVQPQPEAPAEA